MTAKSRKRKSVSINPARQTSKGRVNYATHLDLDDLELMRAYQKLQGVPVSEQIRRGMKLWIAAEIETLDGEKNETFWKLMTAGSAR